MLTGELKNKIDRLWETFWTGGITNPLDVVGQMTYLMFIHDLDETDNLRAKESAMLGLPHQSIFAGEVQAGDRTVAGEQLKWSRFHDFPAGQMYAVVQELVFPFIKELHTDKDSAYAKYMGDAIFKIPTPLMLEKIVTAMDEIYAQAEQLHDTDVRGDIYEFLLSKIATAGVNGQFRTPRHIIRMMVELTAPKADDVICDPACGTAGFLVAAGEYLKERRREEIFYNREKKDHYMNHMFHGFDMDRTMLRIGAMNMMTHGIDNPFIEYRDSLSDQNPDRDKYTLILANPPFKGSLDADIVSADLLKVCKTKKTELLFLALFLRMLKVGGRGGGHRPGRGAVRVLQGPQGYPAGVGGEPPAGGGDLHALRGVQALRRGVHGGAGVHQDGPRRHGPGVVLRHEGGRLLPGRQAHRDRRKRHSRHRGPVSQFGGGAGPPAHPAVLLGAEGRDRGERL